MGAYDNPDVNVGIDRQSGRMIGQAIAGIGQQIGGAVSQRAEKIAAAEEELADRKRKEAEKLGLDLKRTGEYTNKLSLKELQKLLILLMLLKVIKLKWIV